MASLPTGSDELVYIETEKIRLTVKGSAAHPDNPGAEYTDKDSTLKVYCDESFDIDLKGESALVSEYTLGHTCYGEYTTIPIFFEQQNYEIIIESLDESDSVSFWHDNFNVRKQVEPVGRNPHILSGVINFGNEIGMSDLVVRVNGKDYLRIVIEVFPSKISYKDDYKAIVADVTAEVYDLIFDFLKKTYMSYRQSDNASSSPVEFFAVISHIYDDFIKAADMILASPHHELEAIHSVLPSHKIKQTDNQSVSWIEKHPEQAIRKDGRVLVSKTMAVQKQVTYDTKENRLTKYILESTAKKLLSFKRNYMNLSRGADEEIIKKIDNMIAGINRRCNTGVLAQVSAMEGSFGMSLVFSMASGYRDLYKYYLMLLHGLSVTGTIFNISIKDLAVLYEYWCFIKLNSMMKEKYELVSQDIIKTQGNGLFVSLVKGNASHVKYRNPRNGESIILTYNPIEPDMPTATQRPDNVLTLKKHGSDTDYEYIFDAKYRINPALPGTDYKAIYKTPGPEVDTINTMHRYRDAIVSEKGVSNYERSMFGAYVLFPYNNENEYRHHRFYESIEKVNIGGVPFLPTATALASELLDSLISDSPDSAFERTTLPLGIEEKLARVDWDVRDVLVGTLHNKDQLPVCLDHKFYYVPAANIPDKDFPIHYIAIYQSKNLFGTDAGIKYYGEVTTCSPVSRDKITETPSDNKDLYYRFDIKEWKELPKPIAVKGVWIRTLKFTNLFLLEHSSEAHELSIRSEEEYRLYTELKRAINDTTINDEDNNLGFIFGDFAVTFDNGKICISKNSHIFAEFDIADFSKQPGTVFRRIEKEIERVAEKETV